MNDFPVLKTGAILQFPAGKETRFSSQVIRFIDGTEQRFRDFGAPLHLWTIRLDQLDESELNSMRNFFRTQRGSAGTFAFVDPWDGTEYSNCSLESDEMVERLLAEGKSQTTLLIKENRV